MSPGWESCEHKREKKACGFTIGYLLIYFLSFMYVNLLSVVPSVTMLQCTIFCLNDKGAVPQLHRDGPGILLSQHPMFIISTSVICTNILVFFFFFQLWFRLGGGGEATRSGMRSERKTGARPCRALDEEELGFLWASFRSRGALLLPHSTDPSKPKIKGRGNRLRLSIED